MSQERNEEAKSEIVSEMEKLGIKREVIDTKPNPNDEQEEETPKTEEKKVEEKPKADEKKLEGEKKPDESRPKKYIPIEQYTAEKAETKKKFEEMQSTIEELKKGSTTKEEVNTDVKAFAESLGVEDPEVLEKIMTFMTTGTKKTIEQLEKKIDDLTILKKDVDMQNQIKVEEAKFNSEWDSFVKTDFKDAYPDATPEQLAEARSMMDEMSHSKDWSKYDLNYIFFKNKADFNDALGTKKFKGSGPTKTQGITEVKKTTGAPKLSDNPTTQEIKDYEAYMGSIMNKGTLAEKPNETL